jgi:6-phosphogluconolactonase
MILNKQPIPPNATAHSTDVHWCTNHAQEGGCSSASFLVHISSSQSRQIHAFLQDSQSGRLELLEVIDVPGSGSPTRGNIPLSWGLNKKVLYAHVRIDPYPLSAFELDASTGKLHLVDSVHLPAPMAYLSVTRNGRFLLAASYDGGQLTAHRIEADGRVSDAPLQIVPTPPKAHCVMESPFRGYVYATSVDGEVILVYHLDEATGQLKAVEQANTPTRPGSGPRHLAFHPKMDRLYCINESSGVVAAYSVDRSTGALKEIQHEAIVSPDFVGRPMGADIHLTPDGNFVYASVRNTNSITALRIDPKTGLMAHACTFEVEPHPRGFAITPDGRHLLCAGQKSNQVTVFSIHPDHGDLTHISSYAVGEMPSWIEIIPSPKTLALR